MATTTQDPNTQDPNALTLAKPKPQVPGQAGGTPLSLAPTQQPTIPAPTVAAPSAPVDRLALAKSNFDTFTQQTDPAYQASLREAASNAAGQGQLGSGQYRTSIGNLVLARQRDLDTQRADLVNKATEGSIADATTAYQQQLAAAQQAEANKLGEGNLSIAKQSADTAKLGTVGGLDIQKGQLDLARTGQAASIDQNQQQIDLAKKTADINAAYQAGQLTLAQKDEQLRELAQSQSNDLATQQLELAKTGQAADIENQKAQLALQKAGLSGLFADGSKTLQAKEQEVQDAIAQGRLTVEEGQLAVAQLAQKAQADQAKAQLAEQTAARLQQGAQFDKSLAQSADQFKATLDQNAKQFGLSQDQQLALAKLQNDTQNKQIDASTAQGKNQLLVQLASILGGPTGTLNPTVIAAIAKSFGVILPSTGQGATVVPPAGGTGDGGTGDGGGSEGG